MPKMIQLRHVPDDLHRKLKARAALEGLSLSDYLLREVRRVAERPTLRARASTRSARARGHSVVNGQSGESRARSSMIVVDASAVLEVLLNTPDGGGIAARLFAEGETLHAPHLLDLEVTQ